MSLLVHTDYVNLLGYESIFLKDKGEEIPILDSCKLEFIYYYM